ncbi:hypothetical protein MKJ04_16100 [Pontibacter sp. E15-1]|uniref:hypothetical protein n=1 Tax=Pontibacter sp. E15-1 TaxID=2919918 RepID=UPI001F501AA6|nr:hypothetical protein [Pontibacter sp. E15-1]MCJ8166369.1 hypothetical protein [Pontibacter sp. E15-1]
MPESAKDAASPQSILQRMVRVVGHTLLRLIGNLFRSVEEPATLRGKVWLYVVSQNNVDSLRFVQQRLPGSVLVAGQGKNIGKYEKEVARLSLRRKVLYYYKLPFLLLQFLRHKRASTLRFFDLLYDAIGFYEVYLQKLRRYQPAAVVFANDHNADARAMLLAAKALQIKTVYIQHASVSNLFPPLTFDLNLLEGQDSLDKYLQCGPVQGQVALVGMPKADAYVPFRNHSTHIRTVGIGCNMMDDLQEVAGLLRKLSDAFPSLTFILRPHPRDTRNRSALTKIARNITISNGKEQHVFDYLKQLDVQISSTSGIHLEAVLLNVWSIFYDFNPTQHLHDYYGFIQHGLVDVTGSAEELVQLLATKLDTRPEVYHRARFYNATVATPQDGKSGELALKHICSLIKS